MSSPRATGYLISSMNLIGSLMGWCVNDPSGARVFHQFVEE
jgi:hypothetical protein